MARQQFSLQGSWFNTTADQARWQIPAGSRPQIDAILAPPNEDRFLAYVGYATTFGQVFLYLTSDQNEIFSDSGDDLSDNFESSGSFRTQAGSEDITTQLSGRDTVEPYNFSTTGDERAEVVAFTNALLSQTNVAATFTIDDGQSVDHDLGVDFAGSLSGSLAVNLDIDEAVETHNLEFAFGGSVSGALAVALDHEALPDAVAPTVTIPAVADGVGGTSIQLAASVGGGTYDSIAYAWTVTHGTLDDATSATPTWTRPASITVDTVATIGLTVTVGGDGTIAKDGTSATVSASSVTSTITPPLLLSDRITPDGHSVTYSILVRAEANSLYNVAGTSAILDGDSNTLAAHSLIFTRIYVTGNDQLRISDSGAGDIETLFLSGDLSDALINIQTAPDSTAVTIDVDVDIDAQRSTGARAILDVSATELAALDGIGDGDRFIFSIFQPAPDTYDLGVSFDGSVSGALSLSLDYVRDVQTHDLGVSFSGSVTGAFAPSLDLIEQTETFDIGIGYDGTVSGSLSVGLQLIESASILDIGIAYAGNVAGSFALGIDLDKVTTFDVGIAYAGNVSGSLAVGIALLEQVQTHDLGVAFSGSVAGAFALGLQVEELPVTYDIAVAFAGSVSGALAASPSVLKSSDVFRASAFAAETAEVWLMLLKIEHPDLTAPIRIVNNNEEIVSNSQTFIGLAFDIVLPIDSPDRPPEVKITVDNVSRELIESLRSISSSPTVDIQFIRASDPDIVELEWNKFTLRDVRWDAQKITGTLSQADIVTEAFPADTFSPVQFRGLV